MNGLFWLSQEQFDRIRPYLPLSRGVPRAGDDLQVISGIIYVMKNGLQWTDAPLEYGPHHRLYHRFIRWSRRGVFKRICAELSADGITLDWLIIEAGHLDAHQKASRLSKKGMLSGASMARKRTAPRSKDAHIPKRCTTLGLELELQDVLKEVAYIEGCTVRNLCTAVCDAKSPTMSFATALRVFLVEYYRSKCKSVENNEVTRVLEQSKSNRLEGRSIS